MNKEVEMTVKDIEFKIRTAADNARDVIADAIQWGKENPELVLAGITAVAALMRSTRSIVVSHRVAAERARITKTFYDPSTGFHWQLRRAATNADRAEILRRRSMGQDTYSILKDLHLIK